MQYFFNADNREKMAVAPGVNIRTFWGAQMLGAVVNLDANAVVPLHSHPHEQMGMVISGELKLTIGDETRVVKAGDAYLIPGDVEHTAVVGPVDTVAFELFSPVREAYQY